MDNNNSKPKYHYVQCFVSYATEGTANTWDDVKRYVNDEGYEIYQMCSLRDYIVYLLRKEVNCGVKEIS